MFNFIKELQVVIFTVRQGYVFTGVCDSVHGGWRGGVADTPQADSPGQTPPWEDTLPLVRHPWQIPTWQTPPGRRPRADRCPLGRHTPQADTSPQADIPPRSLLQRMVRLLLECILGSLCYHFSFVSIPLERNYVLLR